MEGKGACSGEGYGRDLKYGVGIFTVVVAFPYGPLAPYSGSVLEG